MDIKSLTERAAQRNLTEYGALLDYFECIRLLEESDFIEAHKRAQEVRRISALEAVKRCSSDMFELNKRALLFDAPYNYEDVYKRQALASVVGLASVAALASIAALVSVVALANVAFAKRGINLKVFL